MEKEYIYVSSSVNEAIEKGLRELGLTEDKVKIEVVDAGSSGLFGFFKKEAKVKLTPLNYDFDESQKKERIIPPTSAVPADFVERSKVEKVLDKAEKEIEKKAIEVKNKVEEVVQKFESVEENSSEQVEKINIESSEESERETEPKKEKREDYIVKNKDSIVMYLENIVKSMGYKDATVDFKELGNRTFSLNIKTEENTSLIIGKRGATLNSLQFLINNFAKKFSSHYFRIEVDCDNYRENRKKTLEELALNLAKKSKKIGKPVELEPMTSIERKIIHNALTGIRNVETESRGEEPYRYLVISAK